MNIGEIEQDFTSTGVSESIRLSDKFNFSLDFSTLSGEGTVELQRSFDDGSTWKTVESNTADVEKVGDAAENILWRTECTVYTSGTITSRVSQ